MPSQKKPPQRPARTPSARRPPLRKRLPAASRTRLPLADVRLGLTHCRADLLEALLFVRAGGLEMGYYTICWDEGGGFADFTYYDHAKEVRAVWESYQPGQLAALTAALEQDLAQMGLWAPRLQAELARLPMAPVKTAPSDA